MSSIGFISTENQISSIKSFFSDSIQDKLDRVNGELKDLPSVLDPETIKNLKDGEYEITLEEYNDLSSYRTMMGVLYGSKSASKFPSMLNTLIMKDENSVLSAKDFIKEMEEKGINKDSALKLYTAVKSYSTMNSYLNFRNSYVSAKV